MSDSVKAFFKRLKENKQMLIGGALLIVLIIIAIFGPMMAPHNPKVLNVQFVPPFSPGHLLGTDHLGRDILSMILYGVRTSIIIGFIAALISAFVGVVVGGVAGGVLRSPAITVACEGNENTGYILAGKSTSVGAITGVSRSVVQMLNSKVGGKVERNKVVTELTEQNYMDYIYGEKWSGDETEPAYDGATFVAPILPEGGEGTEGSGDNTEGTV